MLGWLIAFIIVVTLIIIADLKINDFNVDEDIQDEKKNYKGQKSRENDIIVNLEKFINSHKISREN